MAGKAWKSLQTLIQQEKVKGAWPKARDEWGSCKNKLEAVFVVEIPSEENRDPRRIVPGRGDVFIIPQSDCVPAGGNSYYPSENIVSCFILKAPDDKSARETLTSLAHGESKTAPRVLIKSDRDKHGGMTDVQVEGIPSTLNAAGQQLIDHNPRAPAQVLQCVATVAQPPKAVNPGVAHHEVEQDRKGKSMYPWEVEDVARFTAEEMEFALYALDQALLRPYSLAYCYTSEDIAKSLCLKGNDDWHKDIAIGIKSAVSLGDLIVCTKSPVDLGWDKHATGTFIAQVDEHLGAAPGGNSVGLGAVVVIAVPTVVLTNPENLSSDSLKVSAAREKLAAAKMELEELKKNDHDDQTPGNQEQDEQDEHEKQDREETVDKKTPEDKIKVKENVVDKLKKELETAQDSYWCKIPDEFLHTEEHNYSTVHIQKCYSLGCAAAIKCADRIKSHPESKPGEEPSEGTPPQKETNP